jgi:hypothetical protein
MPLISAARGVLDTVTVTKRLPPDYSGARIWHLGPAAGRDAYDVVSCADAALAKGIPIASELKTIILETSVGVHAVHVPVWPVTPRGS